MTLPVLPVTRLYHLRGAAGAPQVVRSDETRAFAAINIPNTVRLYMNYRQADQRGQIFPLPTTPNGAEGLQDIVLDERRNRVYITNSGYNRVEVFDTRRQKFLDPIPAGQLPHQMALTSDGNTLYVGNTATVRPASTVIPNTLSNPVSMLASSGSEYILTLGGNGLDYIYDSSVDTYTASRQLFNSPGNPIQGYFGVLGTGPRGAYPRSPSSAEPNVVAPPASSRPSPASRRRRWWSTPDSATWRPSPP